MTSPQAIFAHTQQQRHQHGLQPDDIERVQAQALQVGDRLWPTQRTVLDITPASGTHCNVTLRRERGQNEGQVEVKTFNRRTRVAVMRHAADCRHAGGTRDTARCDLCRADHANDLQPRYERITCDDVKLGDRIARTRNEAFKAVVDIREGEAARRLCFNFAQPGARRDWGGDNIRPRRTAKLWREVRPSKPCPICGTDLNDPDPCTDPGCPQ